MHTHHSAEGQLIIPQALHEIPAFVLHTHFSPYKHTNSFFPPYSSTKSIVLSTLPSFWQANQYQMLPSMGKDPIFFFGKS